MTNMRCAFRSCLWDGRSYCGHIKVAFSSPLTSSPPSLSMLLDNCQFVQLVDHLIMRRFISDHLITRGVTKNLFLMLPVTLYIAGCKLSAAHGQLLIYGLSSITGNMVTISKQMQRFFAPFYS